MVVVVERVCGTKIFGDFSTEWIDIKIVVVVVVLVAVSLPNCWVGVDGEEDHFVNCFS
jgi:hypothetical protein